MSVILREKQLKDGGISFYLEINQDKKRKYKFLNIYAYGNRRSEEFKEKKQLAIEARDALQYELSVKKHKLVNENKKDIDFITFLYESSSHLRSKKSIKHLANRITKFAGAEYVPMSDITKEFLLSFQDTLKKEGLHLNTVYGLSHRFSTFITRAVELGYMDFNPFHKIPKAMRIKMRRHTPRYLTEEQILQINKHSGGVHPQVRLAFLFSCFSGLRWGDVSRLLWEDIITQKIDKTTYKQVRMKQMKTEFYVYLPLSGAALQILEERKKDAENEFPSRYVFPHLYEPEDQKSRYNYAYWQIVSWSKKANIYFRFHLSRHTFATTLLSAGTDIYTVSKMLGHTEIKNTQIYANVVDRKKVDAASNFPALSLDKPEPEKKEVRKKAKPKPVKKAKKQSK
jgi:integrase